MSVLGFDISSNNGPDVDFRAAYKAGYLFVYIKTTQGTRYVNRYAQRHANEAKAAGLLVGAYHFVDPQPGRIAAEEVDFFLAEAAKAGLLSAGCLRPAVDSEITALPKGRASRRYHYAFRDRVLSRLGHHPFIYTGSWFWVGTLGALNPHGCPLWFAAYTPSWRKLLPFGGWRTAAIHQETDKGTIGGKGPFDIDRYLGRDVRMLRAHHCLTHDYNPRS